MEENHLLVNEMMHYCGFVDGAGWANNLFIQAARDHGALGAKLTGAGGGGSVFALVNPGEEDRLISAWQAAAGDNQMEYAHILDFAISNQGLIIDQK